MKLQKNLTIMTTVLATLAIGCTAQQMAQFEHDLQQAQQNSDSRQRACVTQAERSWNLYSGTAKGSYEKSIGSGMYEIKVTGPNHSGVCTVTEAGMVRGIMNDNGTSANAQPSGYQSGSSNVGRDYDRGCADAKAGSYDRSGNATKAYEDGWNACHGSSSSYSRSPGSEYDRGCADAKVGSYDRSGNATKAYEDGWNACRGSSQQYGSSRASSSERAGLGQFDATGKIPCAQYEGQPMGQCHFGVARDGNGTATLVVTLPDGRKRTIFFENGNAISADLSQADGSMDFRATKQADLYIINAGHGRYEVPEAVIFGG